MKKLLILSTLFLTACGTTQYQETYNRKIVVGQGGVLKATRSGVEIYSYGLPSGRICKEMGVVIDDRNATEFARSNRVKGVTDVAANNNINTLLTASERFDPVIYAKPDQPYYELSNCCSYAKVDYMRLKAMFYAYNCQ